MNWHFYEFEDTQFKDELMVKFILPAIEWFKGSKNYPYFLLQVSGSNWECALVVEAVLNVLTIDVDMDEHYRKELREKCVQTTRWLLSHVIYRPPD